MNMPSPFGAGAGYSSRSDAGCMTRMLAGSLSAPVISNWLEAARSSASCLSRSAIALSSLCRERFQN